MRIAIQIRKADEHLYRRLQNGGFNSSQFLSDMLNTNLITWIKTQIQIQNQKQLCPECSGEGWGCKTCSGKGFV